MLGLLALICLTLVNPCVAEGNQCFECIDIPHLEDCSIVRQCNVHEICYVEQIVTTSGHVTFNSGCKNRQDCMKLPGRRSASDYYDHKNFTGNGHDLQTVVRRGDITACAQCCDTDYCNNQGCTEIATPANQRGPYCFSCKRQDELEKCRHVVQCTDEQVCSIKKMLISGRIEYDSNCIKKAQCEAIKQTYQSIFGKRSQNTAESLTHTLYRTETNQDGGLVPRLQRKDGGLDPRLQRKDGGLVPRLQRRDYVFSLCILCCETDFCNHSCIKNVRRMYDNY